MKNWTFFSYAILYGTHDDSVNEVMDYTRFKARV